MDPTDLTEGPRSKQQRTRNLNGGKSWLLWAAVLTAAMTLVLVVGFRSGVAREVTISGDDGVAMPALVPVSSTLVTDPVQAASGIRSRAFLEQQAEALRPAFRGIIDQLADVPRYSITATLDVAEAVVTGHLQVLYTNTSEGPLPELKFRLLGNAAPLYGSGRLDVRNVQAGGDEVEPILEQEGVVMRVRLAKPLQPGSSELIEADFTTEVAKKVYPGYGILAQTGRVTRLSGWYPMVAPYEGTWQTPSIPVVGDATLGETSLYRVALTVPSGYDVVSTGIEVSQDAQGEEVVWYMVSGPARDFSLAVSDAFEQRRGNEEGVTISLYALPSHGPNTSIDKGLSMIQDAFAVYESRFGPYPWTEFDMVETEISIGGYEFSGMVFVDSPLRVQGSFLDYRYILAHETAHQWWYNLVGDNQIMEPWLDEAFAAYSASIYLGDTYGPSTASGLIEYWRGQYGGRTAGEPPVDSAALDFSSWAQYRRTVYIHGAFFLDALRGQMGDPAFFRLLEANLSMNRFKWTTTERFLELAQEMAESDLGPLIDEWFGQASN